MRPIEGIHHVTATTADAARNLDFYTRVIGLRLVAKTVNQDDPTVYHLFYGDEEAHPGADLTFFEYRAARRGRPGAGMVHRIVWRVASSEALDFWQQRLAGEGVSTRPSEGSLRFADPEGLEHELVVSRVDDTPLIAEHPDIPARLALQGFEGVRAYSAHVAASEQLLDDVLGASSIAPGTWELRGSRRGGWISFDPPPEHVGLQGAGAVHHVAFCIHDADDLAWVERIRDLGIPFNGLVDRNYFRSIYFREPGGVLYELATDGPGFTVDGPIETLGTKLILPPWFEPHRAVIESHLTPLPDPRTARLP